LDEITEDLQTLGIKDCGRQPEIGQLGKKS
jgi:hypothetical protein